MLQKNIRENPYIAKVHVELCEIYERISDFMEAYKHCEIAIMLYQSSNHIEAANAEIEHLNSIVQKMNLYVETLEEGKVKKFLCKLQKLKEEEKNLFGYQENAFRSKQNVIGEYWDKDSCLYLGSFRPTIHIYKASEYDLIHMRGEFMQAFEGNQIEIEGERACLLPIAVEQEMTEHVFVSKDGIQECVRQKFPKRFQYFKTKGGTKVFSNQKSFYGNPIPLIQDPNKKKIILNIFVDGLAQSELSGAQLKKYMPNTYRFFSKGLICTRAYSAGEWTYPSIANYVSGRYTTDHMMFHNMIDWHLPKETKILAEYFQEKDYYTCYMGGDWRIIPTYGHARGYDRFLYQMFYNGFRIEQVITEAIGQIEAMKETNQFLWISISDLHDVADEFDLPTSVQTHLELADQIMGESGPTSVKQGYSKCKKHQYETMLPYIDLYLGILFRYLEDNYRDEEMTVSLFADHGQGYLIPEGEEFLANERTNVAMMFRDISCQNMQTDEIISSVDYTAMMCKFAGIPYDPQDTAGKLPKVLGGTGRKWALVESLHPKDPFRAALYGEQYTFFFCNDFPVGEDGRFQLVDYETKLIDKEGQIVENEDIKKECVDIILERIDHLILK